MMPAIYRAVRGNQEVVGTSREIEKETGIFYDYVRQVAKRGGATRTGWIVYLVTPCNRDEITNPKEYLAECPGEDPIVGPVSEIAELTGMEKSVIRRIIQTGKSANGWTVKPIKKKPGRPRKDEVI